MPFTFQRLICLQAPDDSTAVVETVLLFTSAPFARPPFSKRAVIAIHTRYSLQLQLERHIASAVGQSFQRRDHAVQSLSRVGKRNNGFYAGDFHLLNMLIA